MPIFEYRCTTCGTVTEKIERQPSPSILCPTCGKEAPRTVSAFSAFSASAPAGGGCSAPPSSGFG